MNSLEEFMVINSNEIMIGNSRINYFPYITNEVDFSPTSDFIMINEENWFFFYKFATKIPSHSRNEEVIAMFGPILSPLCQIGNKFSPKWRHNLGSWIGHLSGFMKYVEFSYNQIESRMTIEKRDFLMYFLRCLNGNFFTSQERLQPIRILRNVSSKKTPNPPKGAPRRATGAFASWTLFPLSATSSLLW